jgi:gluconolactonase
VKATILLLAAGSFVHPASCRAQGAPREALPRQVTVTAIPGVVAAGERWQLVWQGTDNADGLVGTADGGVLFAQEQPSRVRKIDIDGRTSIALEQTHGAGALAIDAQGRIVAVERACTDPGFPSVAAACKEPTAVAILAPQRRVLADSFQGKPLGRLNDLVVDRKGGAYFTVGGAYYVSPSGTVTSLGDDIRSNGVMLSPDERTVYVTNGPVVLAFDVQPDGSVANRRDFGRLEGGGNGDGVAVDAEGRLYVTTAAGVQVLSPQGQYLGLIPTPRPVISAAFSGPDKKVLYVVGSGAQDPDGKEHTTPQGVRNNAKSIFTIRLLAAGFGGRAK